MLRSAIFGRVKRSGSAFSLYDTLSHDTAKKNTVYHTSRTARLGALGRTGKTANAAGDPAMRQTFFFSALGLEVA